MQCKWNFSSLFSSVTAHTLMLLICNCKWPACFLAAWCDAYYLPASLTHTLWHSHSLTLWHPPVYCFPLLVAAAHQESCLAASRDQAVWLYSMPCYFLFIEPSIILKIWLHGPKFGRKYCGRGKQPRRSDCHLTECIQFHPHSYWIRAAPISHRPSYMNPLYDLPLSLFASRHFALHTL